MDLKNSCGCIPGYQARKGLNAGTVKIDPHRFCRLKYKICQNTNSVTYNTKSPEIPDTHFINLGRMKGLVKPGATQWF